MKIEERKKGKAIGNFRTNNMLTLNASPPLSSSTHNKKREKKKVENSTILTGMVDPRDGGEM